LKEEVIDLTDLFKAINKYKWLVILGAIIGLGLGFLMPQQDNSTPVYESSMQLLVGHTEVMVSDADINSDNPDVRYRESVQRQQVLNALSVYQTYLTSDRLIKTYIEMLKNRSTAELVAGKAGDSISTDDVAGRIAAEHIPDTQVIRVTVTGNSPEQAQLIAKSLGEVADEVFKKISNFRDKMNVGNAEAIVSVSVADPATKPSGPANGSESKPIVNAILGLVAGLAVSSSIAIVVGFFSRLTKKVQP